MNAMREPMLVIFDGECGFCRKSMEFVAHKDVRRQLRCEASQSKRGQELLAERGLLQTANDTVIVIEDGRVRLRSDAVLAIAQRLGGAWRAIALFRFVPRILRDAAYDYVARHRGQIIRGSTCCVPSEALRSRRLGDARHPPTTCLSP